MKELRKQRLRGLLDSPRFAGDRAKFCQDAGITNGRLSQLLDPVQPFGDNAALNLVDKLNLDAKYFERQDYKLMGEAPVFALPGRKPEDAFSPLAMLLARMFDKIPEDDVMGRSQAFNAASIEIRAVLDANRPKPVGQQKT